MKKYLAVILILFCTAAKAQVAALRSLTTNVVAETASMDLTGLGIGLHRLNWTVTGILTDCKVKTMQSADNSDWKDLIGLQTCTTNGSVVFDGPAVTWVKTRVDAISGSGSVTVTWRGYATLPADETINTASSTAVPLASMAGWGTGVPANAVFMVDSGTCPTGFSEVAALSGKTLLGTLAANADVGTTGGSDTITPAGTVSQPTFSGTVGQATSSDSAGTPAGTVSQPTFTGTAGQSTSTDSGGTPAGSVTWPAGVPTASWPAGVPTFSGAASTVVVNHVHVYTSQTATTGSVSSYEHGAIDTSSAAAEASISTNNPTGGSANYTPAGTIAWPAGVPTNSWPAGVPTFSGNALAAHSHTITATGTVSQPTFSGNALAAHSHTVTPAGTVSQPTFTGNQFDNRAAFVRVIFCRKL